MARDSSLWYQPVISIGWPGSVTVSPGSLRPVSGQSV
jgi:hypothetical protein